MRRGLTAFFLAGVGAAAVGASNESPGLRAQVIVDGIPVLEYASRGRIYIEALKGKEFSIRLCNPTSERVAVALSVDGRNVIDAKRTSALDATKWVLMPGQTADIPGWQISGETSRRFFFTETSRSYAKWLGDTSNVGLVEAVFFREKRRSDVIPLLRERSEPLGGAPNADAPTSEAGKDSAKSRGQAAPPKSEAERFAATGIGDRTRFAVSRVEFEENPVPAARISIRYEFRAELVRLGVLPREDELFARDRSRGFEHEYAPDPGW